MKEADVADSRRILADTYLIYIEKAFLHFKQTNNRLVVNPTALTRFWTSPS